MSDSLLLSWALRYIKLGWPVIPLKGKIPLTTGGSKDATLGETQVREWWARWPQANVGVATGHAFFAIDIDLKEGGEETWDMLKSQYAQLPETIEQVTGTGGKHILYALPQDFTVKNSASKLGPGVDVRGQGGYIVVAPSLHPETGRRYDWDGLKDIEEQAIAPAPVWLLKMLKESEQRKPSENKTKDKIAAGGRNDALFRIASRLRRLNFSGEEIFASLREINARRCEPPLAESEVRTIAGSAARYAPDAQANVFAQKSSPSLSPPHGYGEVAITFADVEALADHLIKEDDLQGAFRPEFVNDLAKFRPSQQIHIKIKLREYFKERFLTRDFERSLKEARGAHIPPDPPSDDSATSHDGPNLLAFERTDSGNGERIIALFGSEIRYCVEMTKWLIWDGKRWCVDEQGEVTQRAKTMARVLYAQAREDKALTRDEFEEWRKFALKSESNAAINAAIERAASEPGVPIRAAELDQHPFLLNCMNGVIDLKTGKLLPHDRGLLITKICRVNYDENAKCDRFFKFLHWTMGDNPDSDPSARTVRMVAFLQRALGYGLTADVSEKAVFVLHGSAGNNGKTTLLTTFREVLGEFSTQISIDTLMTQRGAAEASQRADLADLRGARFVMTSEVEEEHKLSEGKLKYITAGMGKIKSCRKYENPIEFDATHKLWMDCNHRPRVKGTDDAIWNRLKAIPFEQTISKDDPEFDLKLKDKLVAEAPGILAWAVRGCKAWLEQGLGEPPEVGDATGAWRDHDDPLKDFLEDCCEVEGEAWVLSSRLAAAYAWWCKEEHEKWPLGRTAFLERIHAKGFVSSRSRRSSEGKQMRTIEGLRVKEDVGRLDEGG